MMFSIVSRDLDFFARPDESDHQGKKADGCEDVEDVWHGVRILVIFFSTGRGPGKSRKICCQADLEGLEEPWHMLIFAEVEWFFA